MSEREPGHVAIVIISALTCLLVTIFNTMATFGSETGIFIQTMEEVMQKYETSITPALWSLFLRDFTYIWMLSMHVYLLTCLCKRSAARWMFSTPAVLPVGFHVTLIVDSIFKMTWLVLFDREIMLPSLVLSASMTFSNILLLFFSCHGINIHGSWLNKHEKLDLWLIRILVQNGVALYAAWTSLLTAINLTIVLDQQEGMPKEVSASLSLSFLLIKMLIWFVLENFCLDDHMRYIFSIYPVTIIVLIGSVSHSSTPGYSQVFAGVLLALSCALFAFRVTLMIWRHYKQPLYPPETPAMLPMDFFRTQNRVCA